MVGGKVSASGLGSLARKGTGAGAVGGKPRGVVPARPKDAAAKAKAKKENGNGAAAAPTTEGEVEPGPAIGDGEVRVEEPEEIGEEEEGVVGVGEEHAEEGPSIIVSSDLTPDSPEPHEHEHEHEADASETHTPEPHTPNSPSPSPSPSPYPAAEDPDLEETLVSPELPPPTKTGDEIDDIVNILPSVEKKTRPVSGAVVPDDAPDIPDEE